MLKNIVILKEDKLFISIFVTKIKKMSIIHITQISNKVSELFSEEIDTKDISINDRDRNDKITTRCLAAYAVYTMSECPIKDAALSVVDGGDDNGIDAIYYSQSNNMMLIVQSKYNKTGKGEPDSASIAKFCKGVKDLFNLEFERFNNKINAKKNIIERAISEYDTRYLLILIDTCMTETLAIHSQRNIDDLLGELNYTGDDESEKIVTFERLNQGKVHSSLAQKMGNSPINIELGLLQWGMISEPYKAYYGAVSGKEISNWWKIYKNRLFDKNIRQVLGKTDVNDEIAKTIKDDYPVFWYYNNGITIIANRIEKTLAGGPNRDIGFFKLTNAAIVNGAQTVSTIGKYAIEHIGETNVEDIKVHVRIIQLSDAPLNFGENITKSNNRQNKIENRDFVSQDSEQIRIKKELSIDGIEYNIMRSENDIRGEKSFGLIEATTALACASGRVSLTVQAKSGVGRFFENLEKGIYKEIFNQGTSCYYVYNSVMINRFIEKYLNKKIQEMERRTGRHYLLLVHGNRMISMITIKLLYTKDSISALDFNINEDIISTKIDFVINKMKEYLEEHYVDNFLATVFKNVSKCSEIDNYITLHE